MRIRDRRRSSQARMTEYHKVVNLQKPNCNGPISGSLVVRLQCIVCIAMLISVVGCADKGMDKTIVQGIVSYDGAPVANGEIMLYPLEGTIGPASGAAIVDGKYVIEAKGGVPVGNHAVKIVAFTVAPSNEGDMVSMSAGPGTGRQNYIPAKYNEQSELTMSVESSDEAITRDFILAK